MNPIIFGFLSEPFRKILSRSVMFKMFNKIRPNETKNINNINNNNNNDNNNTHPRTTNNNKLGARVHHGADGKKQSVKSLRRHTHGNINASKYIDRPNVSPKIDSKNKLASLNTLGLVLHNNDKLVEAVEQRGGRKKHTVQLVDQMSQLCGDFNRATSSKNVVDVDEKRLATNKSQRSMNNDDDNFTDLPRVDSSSCDDNKVIHGGDNNTIVLGRLNNCFKTDDDHFVVVHLSNDGLNYIPHDENSFKGASESIDVSIGFESIDMGRNDLDDVANC